MLGIVEAKNALKQLGLSSEKIEEYEKVTECFINFHLFLMERYSMTSEQVEIFTTEETKRYIVENKKNITIDTDTFKLGGVAMQDIAQKAGYDEIKTEELGTNMNKMIELLATSFNI